MIRNATLFLLIFSLLSATGVGQSSRTKTRKPPVIRETVTVKGDLPREPKLKPIYETDTGIWRRFTFSEHSLSIEFPVRESETIENELPDMEGVWTYSADTERATYRIMVKQLTPLLDDIVIAEILDESIASVYSADRSLNAKVREVSYKGKPGREILTVEKGKTQIGRVFILNQKLFAMFVTVDPSSNWPKVEAWARRFFDSFMVELPRVGEA